MGTTKHLTSLVLISFVLHAARPASAQDANLTGGWNLEATIAVAAPLEFQCSFPSTIGDPSIPISHNAASFTVVDTDTAGQEFTLQAIVSGGNVDFTITGFGITPGTGGCSLGARLFSTMYSGTLQADGLTVHGTVEGRAEYFFDLDDSGNPRWTLVTWTGTFVVHLTRTLGIDLVAVPKAFHYIVLQDDTRTFDGPMPVNSRVGYLTQIQNLGIQDSGPFNVRFYLSSDPDIDPIHDIEISWITLSGQSRPCRVPNIRPSQLHRLVCPVDLNRLTLEASFFGRVWVGMVIDADDEVDESDEANNSNQGTDTDRRPVTLYDPIFRSRIVAVFRTSAQAHSYLISQGFTHPRLNPDPVCGGLFYIDRGWSKAVAVPTRSWVDNIVKPVGAFRVHSAIERQGNRYVVIAQGDLNSGEPSPAWAQCAAFDLRWLLYVNDYHARF